LSVIIVLVLLAVRIRYMPTAGQPAEINYSTFLDDVKANRVGTVTLQSDILYGTLKDNNQQFRTHKLEADYSALTNMLEKAGVSMERRPPKLPNFLPRLLFLLAAMLLIHVFVRRSVNP
jgi:ATP-dependent Zn protease